MKWSKLRVQLKTQWHDSLKERIDFHITRYTKGSHFMARAWITLDGEEIANFSLPEHYSKYGWNTPDLNERVHAEDRSNGSFVEDGEFSNDEFTDACWAFLSMNIDDAIASQNPIIQALAMLDKRVGKRRLKILKVQETHPLVQKIIELRTM